MNRYKCLNPPKVTEKIIYIYIYIIPDIFTGEYCLSLGDENRKVLTHWVCRKGGKVTWRKAPIRFQAKNVSQTSALYKEITQLNCEFVSIKLSHKWTTFRLWLYDLILI